MCTGTALKMERGCLAWTGMIKQVCRGWAIANSRTRVSETSSNFWDGKSPLSETT